jgi:large subunit ribosomal protein L17
MRHRNAGRKLGRNSTHRKAMFRNMVTSLFKYDRIRTTDAKAKELRGWADHIVTLAKRGDLHARRQALSIVRERDVVHKVFEEAKERYGGINGGYTRIIKLGSRPGDAASVCLVELVSVDSAAPRKPKKKSRPQAKTAPQTPPVGDAAEAASEAAAEDAPSPAPGTDAETQAAPAEDAPEDAKAGEDEPQEADAAEASPPEEGELAADPEADAAGDETEETSKKEQ